MDVCKDKKTTALDICVGLLLAKFFLASVDFALDVIPRIFDMLPRGMGYLANEIFIFIAFGALAIGALMCPAVIIDVIQKRI